MTLGTQVTAWMPWGDSFESPGKEIRGGTEPVNPSTSANTPAVHTGLRRYRWALSSSTTVSTYRPRSP